MNPAEIIGALWAKALDELDWDPEKGAHVLEVGMETHMCLRKESYGWWNVNIDYRDGSWWFRGTFLVKVIHEPLPETFAFTEEITLTRDDIPRWHHMAIHVQRENGRMRYIDWEGNDERCT